MSVYDQIISKLSTHGCVYTTQHHAPTVTSEEASRIRGVSMHAGAKALVVQGEKSKQYYLFVLPADYQLDGLAVRALLGERIKFAKDPEAVTGCVPGSVPPFGSLFGLQTYVDPRLAENDTIHFNAGSLTDSVSMPYTAYIEIEKPRMVTVGRERSKLES